MIRPGTTESSVREESLPMAGSSRPIRPGDPARGSPKLRAITRSDSQYTPAKLQGSEVKSHEAKKLEPGMSSKDFLTDCRAKKSSGSKIQCTKSNLH